MHETQRYIEATEAMRFRHPRAARGVHGVGSELALASDLRFASREKTILSQWEVGAGLVPGAGPMARLPRLMSRRGRALEVLLGADDIDGDLAQINGYVNRSLPDSELDGFVDAFATRIASFDKQAIADTKRLVDIACLPSDAEIAPEWNAFISSLQRTATQPRIDRLIELASTSRAMSKRVSAITLANLEISRSQLKQSRRRKIPATSFDQRSSSHKSTVADMRSFIKVGRENSTSIELYYEDHGSGPPVVLIHGWPLNGDAWEKQTAALLAAGHRVIAYDRRGFGRSSKPAIGYNYDTFAADLDAVLCALDLTDVSLVGHSMGTGEITRYIGKFGTKRLRKSVLIGTLGPYLVKASDNPEGIDASVFSGLQTGLKADRPATLLEFLKNFYSVGGADGKLVSERVIQANWTVAIGASPIATLACVDAWLEDFRKDISRNDLPTMIIHGDDDRILPADVTSRRQAKMIKGVKFIETKGGSHGLPWTHAEEINAALVEFLA